MKNSKKVFFNVNYCQLAYLRTFGILRAINHLELGLKGCIYRLKI